MTRARKWAFAAALLTGLAARAQTPSAGAGGALGALPSVATLQARAEAHAKEIGTYTCRVMVKDVVGTATGTLKVMGARFALDAERRDEAQRTLGTERVICDGQVAWVLAVPRGQAVPVVQRLDLARIERLAARVGDLPGDRPDLGIRPATVLQELRADYDLAVIGTEQRGEAQLVRVAAVRKAPEARASAWIGAERLTLLIEPTTGFAVYIAKLDAKGEPIREVVAGSLVPNATLPESTFRYEPPRQATVTDVAAELEKQFPPVEVVPPAPLPEAPAPPAPAPAAAP